MHKTLGGLETEAEWASTERTVCGVYGSGSSAGREETELRNNLLPGRRTRARLGGRRPAAGHAPSTTQVALTVQTGGRDEACEAEWVYLGKQVSLFDAGQKQRASDSRPFVSSFVRVDVRSPSSR